MEEQRARQTNGNEAEATPAAKLTAKRPRCERTVNDEEVDEFFTILKRLQEVKRLKNSVIMASDATRRCGVTWQPVFTLDDFKEVSSGQDRKHRATGNGRDDDDDGNENENEVVSRSFDLNAEPEVDPTNC